MDNKILYRIRVRGSVQGVGFRWSTVREARNLNITGYVRNMSDGSVYIEAEGSEEDLARFIEWCKRGPAYGFVDSVEAKQFPPANYKDFRIEH